MNTDKQADMDRARHAGDEKASSPRRAYSKPTLERIGAVVNLTAGYGGMAADGGGPPPDMTMM